MKQDVLPNYVVVADLGHLVVYSPMGPDGRETRGEYYFIDQREMGEVYGPYEFAKDAVNYWIKDVMPMYNVKVSKPDFLEEFVDNVIHVDFVARKRLR